MTQCNRASLWEAVRFAGSLSERFLSDGKATVPLSDVVRGSCLNGRAEELRGQLEGSQHPATKPAK